jgi:hypothetical protein
MRIIGREKNHSELAILGSEYRLSKDFTFVEPFTRQLPHGGAVKH